MPPTPTTFVARLPAGHAVLRYTKVDALDMLKKHTLLMPTFTYNNSVATLKEFCAPVLWADGASFSLGAVKQLSPAERVALCNVSALLHCQLLSQISRTAL